MSKLTKIAKILTLQRTICEREIAALRMKMAGHNIEILKIQTEINVKSDMCFSGISAEGPIREARQFATWNELMREKLLELSAQNAELSNLLNMRKAALKALIVKEDLITSQLAHRDFVALETRLQGEADLRLEHWVMSR